MSRRKLGAVCNFCHKRDSYTEDEYWEKHPKRRKRGAEPSAPEAEPAWDPYMAWVVSVQPGGGALEAFAIFTEEGPELHATTQVAARAKREAARVATRAKEERGRVGGLTPDFKPKGERAPAAAEDANDRPRRQPQRALRGPPAFPEGSGSTAPTTPVPESHRC
jgi:hypothetical protein